MGQNILNCTIKAKTTFFLSSLPCSLFDTPYYPKLHIFTLLTPSNKIFYQLNFSEIATKSRFTTNSVCLEPSIYQSLNILHQHEILNVFSGLALSKTHLAEKPGDDILGAHLRGQDEHKVQIFHVRRFSWTNTLP